MNEDLKRLYRALTPDSSSGTDRGFTLERAAPAGPATAIPGATADHTPLLPEQVDQLFRLHRMAPEAVRELLGKARGGEPVSNEKAREMLDQIRDALNRPADTAKEFESRSRPHVPQKPPKGFGFDLYDEATIPIDVGRRDFQDDDWLGYAIGGGLAAALFHANLLPLDPLRRHDDYPTQFAYPLKAAPGQDLRVALFADFANGYYHSRYIAKRLAKNRYPCAIHLGDVYYGGHEAEVTGYLVAPLAEILPSTELFLLTGNHEMYSKGRPWLSYIDRKRAANPGNQRQEGNYFRLLRDGFQIIGIDTEWLGHLRYRDHGLKTWLANALKEGRRDGRVNVLLSSNEPYSYGKAGTTPLYGDLKDVLDERLVDLWFWGNTHYCALFTRSATFPFIGSCIGHGGYPYNKIAAGATLPVKARFVEDQTRFGGGAWEDPRPEMGNNGYCELVLKADRSVELVYIDWRGRERHRARLARGGDGTLDFVGGQ